MKKTFTIEEVADWPEVQELVRLNEESGILRAGHQPFKVEVSDQRSDRIDRFIDLILPHDGGYTQVKYCPFCDHHLRVFRLIIKMPKQGAPEITCEPEIGKCLREDLLFRMPTGHASRDSLIKMANS